MGDQVAIYNGARLTASQREAADIIIGEARRARLNPAFMLALAVTESSLRPAIAGDDGISIGLFQLQVATAKEFDPRITVGDLLTADQNADIAMQFMAQLHQRWPGRSYADYAEAWSLGGYGRFDLNRRNPKKVFALKKAVTDLDLNLDVDEVWI